MVVWKPITYNWAWQLKSSPEALWPYVADTNRFNQASGLPTIDYLEIPLETGGSRRIGRTAKFGILVQYEDYPFEWIKEQGFSNLRIFKRGPLARTYAKLTLEPNDAGTLLKYDVEVTPSNLIGLLGIPYQFGWEMRRNFERVFRQIDEGLQNQIEQPYQLKVRPLDKARLARLSELTRQLSINHELRWSQYLADLVTNGIDLDLTRIRPYVLADAWQAPRRTILEMFLSAAKLGILNLRWDIMCPLCRGAKASATSLDEIRKGVHCATCNIDFEADFAQNVELTFTPHSQIRTIQDDEYCIGGPMVTPHILVHQMVEPGQTRTLVANLEPGSYRLRTQRPGVETRFDLNSAGQIDHTRLFIQADVDTIQVSFQPLPQDNSALSPIKLNPTQNESPITLSLTNKASDPQSIYLERANWYTDAVTAAQVTTLQHFRDLFSDEVLRPGEEIGVQGMTILFSDLVGSTAMYNRWGDASSYALVREQFAFLQRIVRKYDGAIVKTIGDAIMAAFVDPAKGVAAALTIQNEVHTFNTDHPNASLTIKLGLHQGPCLAVNLNEKLDYFGTTVNLAARLEGQSRGGDVVISEKLRRDPAVDKLLETVPVDIVEFSTVIKGFDEDIHLYRLIPDQVETREHNGLELKQHHPSLV